MWYAWEGWEGPQICLQDEETHQTWHLHDLQPHPIHYGSGNKINKPDVMILAHSCDGGQPKCSGGVDEMCDELLAKAQLCE